MVASRAVASERDRKIQCAFLRDGLGFSTRDLARLYRKSPDTISNWLKQVGRDNPPELEGLRRLLDS